MAEDRLEAVNEDIARYYRARVIRHGATPEGVDWRCAPTQQLRFVQLLKILESPGPHSLNDLGCGWGALRAFLAQKRQWHRVDYLGVDLVAEMVAKAQALWPRDKKRFVQGSRLPRVADYSLASGIFNVRLELPLGHWELFVEAALRDLHNNSRYGFAVNFMAPLPAGMDSPPQLYRPDIARWASFCETELSGRVERVSGYGLREETLLVRR